MKTGRPMEVDGSRYEKEPWNVAPGAPGGHTWHPNAYSPDTGLIYVPTWENYSAYADLPKDFKPTPGRFSIGVSLGAGIDRSTLKPYDRRSDTGLLKAWDPVARKVVWQTEAGPRATSGVLATAGNLVFMGNGPGKALFAYDAKTGQQLWSFDAKTAVLAAPISYELDGVQYVAASVGGTAQGGYFAPTYARMLVFALGGQAVLPESAPYTPPPLDPPASTAAADVIARGEGLYTQHCSVCHGANGVQARTSFPNLTVTPLLHTQEGFDQVVLQGARTDKGMGSFAKDLTAEDSAAVREYIISRAHFVMANPQPAFGPPPPPPPAPRRETGHAED
jgi:glucose dehydrogenase